MKSSTTATSATVVRLLPDVTAGTFQNVRVLMRTVPCLALLLAGLLIICNDDTFLHSHTKRSVPDVCLVRSLSAD